MSRKQRIERLLNHGLFPEYLDVVDESYRHAGHAGARPEGETHFKIVAVSGRFEGLSRVARHRVVYALLQDEQSGGLHALSLELSAPSEGKKGPLRSVEDLPKDGISGDA